MTHNPVWVRVVCVVCLCVCVLCVVCCVLCVVCCVVRGVVLLLLWWWWWWWCVLYVMSCGCYVSKPVNIIMKELREQHTQSQYNKLREKWFVKDCVFFQRNEFLEVFFCPEPLFNAIIPAFYHQARVFGRLQRAVRWGSVRRSAHNSALLCPLQGSVR